MFVGVFFTSCGLHNMVVFFVLNHVVLCGRLSMLLGKRVAEAFHGYHSLFQEFIIPLNYLVVLLLKLLTEFMGSSGVNSKWSGTTFPQHEPFQALCALEDVRCVLLELQSAGESLARTEGSFRSGGCFGCTG